MASKFLRFQELEVEIDECVAEIERLRRTTGVAGTVVGKLRISTASQPIVPSVDKLKLPVGKPARPTEITTSNQASGGESGAVRARDEWNNTALPSEHARVTAHETSDQEGPTMREGFVSKARRRAIEADYYKQVRLAQLEAECELKENVRIRAAREARKMRLAAEQQRQQQEMARAKVALASTRSPVASGTRRSRVKEQPIQTEGTARVVNSSNEEHPTRESIDPDHTCTRVSPPPTELEESRKQVVSDQTAASQAEEERSDKPESTGRVGTHESMSNSLDATTEGAIGEVRTTLSTDTAANPAEGNSQVQQSSLPAVDIENESKPATESATTSTTASSLSAETLLDIVEPPKDEVIDDESTDQPNTSTDHNDDEKPPYTATQSQNPKPDVDDIGDISPASPIPSGAPTTEAENNTDKMKMYEEEDFDDGGEEEEEDSVEIQIKVGASVEVDPKSSIPLAEDTTETPVTIDSLDAPADELSDAGAVDADIGVELGNATPEEASERDEIVPTESLPREDPLASEVIALQVISDDMTSINDPDLQLHKDPASEETPHDTAPLHLGVGTNSAYNIAGDVSAESDEDLSALTAPPQLEPEQDTPGEAMLESDGEVNPIHGLKITPALAEESTGNDGAAEHDEVEVTTPTADTSESQYPSDPVVLDLSAQLSDAVVHNSDEFRGAELARESHVGVLLGGHSAGSACAEELEATPTDAEVKKAPQATPIVQESDAVPNDSAIDSITVASDHVAKAEVDEEVGGNEDATDADPAAASMPGPDDVDAVITPATTTQPVQLAMETPEVQCHAADAPTPRDDDISPTTARSMEDSDEVYTPEFVSPREEDDD